MKREFVTDNKIKTRKKAMKSAEEILHEAGFYTARLKDGRKIRIAPPLYTEPKEGKKIYLIGALKNSKIPLIGKRLRELGFEVFDDWHSPGPDADVYWQKFEKVRGNSYIKALNQYAAKHIYDFDFVHLNRADIVILILPCGKSGHLEFGWAIGRGKIGYVLFEVEPERWDIMYQFADGIFMSLKELEKELKKK